jgi:hypothetical protein
LARWRSPAAQVRLPVAARIARPIGEPGRGTAFELTFAACVAGLVTEEQVVAA